MSVLDKLLNDLSAEQVRSFFTYDPETGELRWRNAAGRWGRIPAGTLAGRVNHEGYRYITIQGKQYRSCRLIWLYMTGEWPSVTVDHADTDPTNDRWGNLRLADLSEQKRNNKRRRDNSTGFKCVIYYNDPRYRDGKHYRYRFSTYGKTIHGPRYLTAEEAYAAYCAIIPKYHGEFARVA